MARHVPKKACYVQLDFQRHVNVMFLLESFDRKRPKVLFPARYNILAGYVGNNMEPWFLYGVDMPDARRRAIFQLHGEKLPNGQYANFGWPKYVPLAKQGCSQGNATPQSIHETPASTLGWVTMGVGIDCMHGGYWVRLES